MVKPIDITNILTAAAPIVASLVTIFNGNKSESLGSDKRDNGVTINNIFYTNSDYDAERAAKIISEQVANSKYYSESRYML